MEKRTMEEIISKLGMGDHKQVLKDKVLACDEHLIKSTDENYKKSIEKCSSTFQLIAKTLEDCGASKKLIFRFEEETNDMFAIENEYMYESGFNDGLNLALNMMDIIR